MIEIKKYIREIIPWIQLKRMIKKRKTHKKSKIFCDVFYQEEDSE
jgi:hypothetical protein